LESGQFHEAIPEGEDGKGRIKVWDHGTYEVEKWTADHIDFALHGSQISGRFSLVRFKESEPLSWFLMKRRET
jgi:bifunctional non-homologous end joining protein LigD